MFFIIFILGFKISQAPSFTLYKSPELECYEGCKDKQMGKELQNKLIRCTIDNMISACNVLPMKCSPQKHELVEMAEMLCQLYLSLGDKYPDANNKKCVCIFLKFCYPADKPWVYLIP